MSDYDPRLKFSRHAGFIPVEIGSKPWRNLYESVNFTLDSFVTLSGRNPSPRDYLPGFKDKAEIAAGFENSHGTGPSLWSTNMGLKGLWWGQAGLNLRSVERFHDKYGKEGIDQLVRFLAQSFSRENGYGGFKTKPSDYKIDLQSTHFGIDSLTTLEDMWGERGVYEHFKQLVSGDPFSDILNFIKACWHEEGSHKERYHEEIAQKGKAVRTVLKNYLLHLLNPRERVESKREVVEPKIVSGGYSTVPEEPISLWGTYAAIDTLEQLMPNRLGLEKSTEVVREVRAKTPLIIEFLRLYDGNFGFGRSSPPNLFSTVQALRLGEILYFLNTGKIDNEGIKEFIEQYVDRERLVKQMIESCDPNTGLPTGYIYPKQR